MSPPESGRSARAGSNRLAWLGALGALLVALLVMSNVLLWQIADQRTTTSRPSGGSGGGGASQPLLPAPSSGTSNKASAAELDRLTRVLNGQFKALQAQLTPLTGGLSAIGAVPGALNVLAAQGRALVPLGGLAGAAAGQLRQVAASTQRLQTVQDVLGRIRANIAAVNSNTGNLTQSSREASRKLTTSNAGIATTNTQLTDVSSKLAAMNTTLGSVDKTIGGVNGNTSDVAASVKLMKDSIDGLRSDFQGLDHQFALYFQAFCQSQTPKPAACP